jgi:hypothetical protein
MGWFAARPPQENQRETLAVVEDHSHKPDPKREYQHTANDAVGLETQSKQKQDASKQNVQNSQSNTDQKRARDQGTPSNAPRWQDPEQQQGREKS